MMRSLKDKFLFLILPLFLVPFSAAVYLFVKESNKNSTFVEKEIVGVYYHHAIFDVTLAVQRYYRQIYVNDAASGLNPELEKLKKEVISKIDEANKFYPDFILLGLADQWNATKNNLLGLIEQAAKEHPQASFAKQNQLIIELNDILKKIGNKSNLILDPEIETYFMMDIMVNIIPDINQLLDYARSKVMTANGGVLTDSEKQQLLQIKGKLEFLAEKYRYAISTIENNDPENVSDKVEKKLEAMLKLDKVLVQLESLAKNENVKHDSFIVVLNNTNNAFDKSYHEFAEHLNWHLNERMEGYKQYRLGTLIGLFLSLGITIIVFISARKNLVRRDEFDVAMRTQAILATVVDGIITINKKGIIESFNASAERIFGYKAKEVIGKNINMLMPEPYAKTHDGYLQHHLKTGEKKIIGIGREVEAKRKDGTIFPIELGVSAFSSRKEKMFVGSIRDISKSKEARRALKESEERYQFAVQGSSDGLWDWDLLTNDVYFSKRFKELIGYSDDEIENRLEEWESLLHEDDKAPVFNAVQNHFKDRTPYNVEYRLKTKSGEYIWFAVRGQAVWDENGKPIRMAGNLSYINDKKKLTAYLDSQVDAINRVQAVIEFNLDGTVITANNHFLEIMGYGLEEIKGQYHSFFISEAEKNSAAYLKFWEDLKRGKNLLGEYKRLGKGGVELWIEGSYSPIFDEHGKAYKIVEFATNITQRKESEQKLLKYADDLEWKSDALEAAKVLAEHAQKEAEDANRSKSDFLATMSHEIRTPMNGIIGMTELLLDTNLTPKQESHAKTVMHSAEALLEIINDILDFSKIEAGRLELDPTHFNLRNLCEDVSELLSVKTREKSIELILNYPHNIAENVIGDAGRIRQIINNYLSNAIKFTQTGYIYLNIEEEKEDDLDENKVKLKISVTDTGLGILKENIKKLFAKFIQADSSTTRKFGGTGLGLAICKQLSELMDGSAGVVSKEGEGSTFWATMVLQKDKASNELESYSKNLQGVKALVVDDIAINQELLCEKMGSAGMLCDICDSAEDALMMMSEAVQSGNPYEIVLIDHLMPEINGEELARKIRSVPQFNKSHLVMFSSACGATQIEQFKSDGFAGYISKPIRSRQMLALLAIIVNKSKAGEEKFFITLEDSVQKKTDENLESGFAEVGVLVAEDNRINQEFATEILEGLGCSVHIAANGREAVNALTSGHFDIVFMDVHMPIMDGYEAAKIITSLKQEGKINEVPVVALTASDIEDERERCLASGMVDFITKPMRKNTIQQALIKHLPKSKIVLVKQKVCQLVFKDKLILLVEDNRINREFAIETLKSLGCKVEIASNGLEAIEQYQCHELDLILMDVQMPKMDGYEATKEIRKLDKSNNKHTPIVALTANAMKGDSEKCKAAGMDDYLSKPVKKDDLKNMLCVWLSDDRTSIKKEA